MSFYVTELTKEQAEISKYFDIPTSEEYKLNLEKAEIKAETIFQLNDQQLAKVLQIFNDSYVKLENQEYPPKGYRIDFIKKGKNLELILRAYGKRDKGTEIPQPNAGKTAEESDFVKAIEKEKTDEVQDTAGQINTKYDRAIPEEYRKHVRCIKSLEGNPLFVTQKYTKHFLECTIEQQIAFIRAAQSALALSERELGVKLNDYTLNWNCGKDNTFGGHQTYGHCHMNVFTGLKSDIRKVTQELVDTILKNAKERGITDEILEKMSKISTETLDQFFKPTV